MYQAGSAGVVLRSRSRILATRIWLNVGSTVLLLGLTSLLTDISSEMVSTTLPIYLLVTLRFSPFQVGLIDGIYQGAAGVVNVFGGLIADRRRRPKQVAAA